MPHDQVDPAYVELNKNQKPPDQLVEFLKIIDFWGYTYKFMQAIYGPLRLLQLADMKTACMDKLQYFVLRTDNAIKNDNCTFEVWNELEEKENGLSLQDSIAHVKKNQ